jgi:hypothetical protein
VLGILLQPLLWGGGCGARRSQSLLWLAVTIIVSVISATSLAQYLGSGSVGSPTSLLPTEQPFDVLNGQLGVGMPLAVGAWRWRFGGWCAIRR